MKIFLLMILFLRIVIFAQSEETLEVQLQNKLDELIVNYNINGVSAAVNIQNDIKWKGASGYSDPAAGELIDLDMIFGIASVTKTFTAALILKLNEENKFSLSDSLHKFLPAMKNINSDITIAQLLNHTSGLANYTTQAWVDSFRTDPEKKWLPEEVINTFVDKPIFDPGTKWEYCNTNYLLLGLIIESVTGKTFHEILRSNIFNPLNLTTMFLEPEETSNGNYADNWFDLDGDGQIENISNIPKTGFNSSAWAAGSISSTAEDLAQWGYNLFNLEFLSPESLEEMLDLVETGHDNFYYGLGIMNFTTFPCDIYGHTGETIGYTSILGFDAVHNASFALLINQSSDIENIGREFALVIENYYANNPTGIETYNSLTKDFRLKQNYPNPFNPSTNIEFSVPQKSFVTLKVFDVLGNEITKLVSKELVAGNYKITFNVSGLASGIYFYKLTSQNIYKIKKMIILK